MYAEKAALEDGVSRGSGKLKRLSSAWDLTSTDDRVCVLVSPMYIMCVIVFGGVLVLGRTIYKQR